MATVNLLDMRKEDLKQFLDSFDHVFSDCDGVVWIHDAPLPDVGKFFKLMKQNGKTVNFVSNSSTRSKENYMMMFNQAGIPEDFNNITIPSIAMAEYLKSINFDKHIYCLTCSESKRVFESYGFKTKYGPEVCTDDIPDFIEYLTDDPDIGAVAVDSDYKINMPKVYKTLTYLKRPEVLFFNGPTDKLMLLNNMLCPAVSFFTEIIANMSNRKPIQLGKPSKVFGEFAMRRAGVTDPSRVLFIGDMIEQDIRLGKNIGFKTLLLLSHFNEEEMRAHSIQPDFYAPSLASIVPKLMNK